MSYLLIVHCLERIEEKAVYCLGGLLFRHCIRQNPVKKHSWLDWTEYALLLGSGAGTVASVATQQVLLAAAPLSLLAALGLIDRRQLQTKLSQSQSVMLSVNSKLDERLKDLHEQLEDLPTHEQLSAVRQSVIAQNQQDILSLSQIFEYTRDKLTSQIEERDIPELQELRQYLVKLQEQYTALCIDLKDIKSRCQQLSDMSRLEATEGMIAKLKAELMQLQVRSEKLGVETKNNYTGFNHQLEYLKQQIQQLTTDERQLLLKEEVQELVKTVSEMVSRDEFLELSTRFQELRVDKLMAQDKVTAFNTVQMAAEHRLKRLEQQLGQVTNSILETVTETVESLQPQELARIEQLQQRLDVTDQQLDTITESVLDAVAETLKPLQESISNGGIDNQWLLDFTKADGQSNSRQALEQLLDQTRERLVLVWPWANSVALDEGLLQQFRQVLERGARLDIGWCHQGDNHEHRLLRSINQRWSQDSTQHQQLKHTLNQLLPLKQTYPDLFSFKILGTTENFAVCDSTCALIGMQALATQTNLFPRVQLKLRTSDPAVIQPLIQRFEDPSIGVDDAEAFFNRGITRYDIRDYTGAVDDFTQVIGIRPSAIAYNCRGVAWIDTRDYARALQDFGHAIRLDARLFAARCNRGVLRIEVRDYAGALNDFDVAVDLCPQNAIPYFYQGQAHQGLGDLRQAVRQFGLAIERKPDLALPYCYRAAAYQRQGKLRQAMADLETAARLLRTTGDVNNLNQVMRKLEILKQGQQVKIAVVA